MGNSKVKMRQNDFDTLFNRLKSDNGVDGNTIKSLQLLKDKLEKTIICNKDEELENYTEFDSIVSVKTSFGIKYGLRIVKPEDADIRLNKLSVLSSLGSAVFGNKVGDKVTWFFQGEEEYAVILKVIKTKNEDSDVFQISPLRS